VSNLREERRNEKIEDVERAWIAPLAGPITSKETIVAKKAVKKTAKTARKATAKKAVRAAGAALTTTQLKMITTPRQEILTRGASAAAVRTARSAVIDVNRKCILTAAKYNEAALKTGDDARKVFDKAEVEQDRATLESLFTEDYNFVDPFGVVGNRDSTIDAILSGKIRKDSFRTTAEALQIHDSGKTVVSTGKFNMKGKVQVRYKDSGAVRDRDLSGTYLSTHTFVTRDGRLQLASSHLTQQPSPKEFKHAAEK
jgi:hypothetical protein